MIAMMFTCTQVVTMLVYAASLVNLTFSCSHCLRFCFMDLIQTELATVAREWNTHRIRTSSDSLTRRYS